MEQIGTKTFVIVGGTTKSGTSSVFNYLAAHPDIQGSSMKETRFFLDQDYPIKSKYRYPQGLEHYLEFFQSSSKKICMEASPDYLYSKRTPWTIHQSLPDSKLVFILRNPADRFVSWYNFCAQNGTIDKNVSLQQYFQMQVSDDVAYSAQHLMTLKQGKYSQYLLKFIEVFGKDRVHICFLEDLKKDPHLFMVHLCDFLCIKPTFYQDYQFEIHNATKTLRNRNLHGLYLRASYEIRKRSHNKKYLHTIMKSIKNIVMPAYLKLNDAGEAKKLKTADSTFLQEYYKEESVHYEERYKRLTYEQDEVVK